MGGVACGAFSMTGRLQCEHCVSVVGWFRATELTVFKANIDAHGLGVFS